jgi:hypothetical protein
MNEIQTAVAEILPDVIAEAVVYFQKAIADKEIINTADLSNSVHGAMTSETVGQITFNDYGRFRDMKSLTFNEVPNIGLIEAWVKAKGVSNFAWVPGYAIGSVPTETIAIRKIASAIAQHMASIVTIKRKDKGWYNSGKANMINVTRSRVTERVAQLFSKLPAETLDN